MLMREHILHTIVHILTREHMRMREHFLHTKRTHANERTLSTHCRTLSTHEPAQGSRGLGNSAAAAAAAAAQGHPRRRPRRRPAAAHGPDTGTHVGTP